MMKVGCFLTLQKKTMAADKLRALQQLRIASSIGNEFDFSIRLFESWIRFDCNQLLGAVEFVSHPPPIHNYGCSSTMFISAKSGMVVWRKRKHANYQIPTGIQPKSLFQSDSPCQDLFGSSCRSSQARLSVSNL